MQVLSRAGQRVAYDDLGEGPRAVVLAHNLLSHRGSFADVAARLAPCARVLNVDLRGHGDSGGAGPFSVADLADDLAAVIEAAGVDGAVLVGTSLGAAAACELARTRPTRVRGLALLAANPRPSAARDRLSFEAATRVVRALGTRPLLPTFVAALHAADAPAATRAASAAHIRAMAPDDVVHAVRAWASRPPITGVAGSIPARVVAGGADASCPWPSCAALAAALGVPLEVLPGAGHTLQAERPAEVAAIARALLGA